MSSTNTDVTVKRYFHKHSKSKNPNWDHHDFWEIALAGTEVRERKGTHGTLGQVKTTDCGSEEFSLGHYRAILEEIEREGWTELTEEIPNTGPERFFSTLAPAIEKKFLQCLDDIKKGSPQGFYFNAPATEEEIIDLEESCAIFLPESLRTFLTYFNGGFICTSGPSMEYEENVDVESLSDKEKRERSYPILSVAEMKSGYQHNVNYMWGPGIVPIGTTYNGERVAVWALDDWKKESPVVDAFHEYSPIQFRKLYATFAHYFLDYVQKKGDIFIPQHRLSVEEIYRLPDSQDREYGKYR